jgi:hypothetical protein
MHSPSPPIDQWIVILFRLQVRNQQGYSVSTLRWTSQRSGRVLWVSASLHLAALAGCGQSSDVRELPEDAKKVLIQRKVDFEKKPATSSPTGKGLPKGRSARQAP